jgi:hypothetical protein
MATKPRPLPNDLRDLLRSVIAEINESVPSNRERKRQWKAARYQVKKILKADRMSGGTAGRLSAIEKLILEDVAADDGEMWRNYFASERAYYLELFRTLDLDGRLPKSDLDDLVYLVNADADFKLRVVGKSDDARIVMEPKSRFELPQTRWGYAMLKLIEAGPVAFRVIACKQCNDLFLVEPGAMGRPREFCSPEHSAAFTQRAWRRKKAQEAAKHK